MILYFFVFLFFFYFFGNNFNYSFKAIFISEFWSKFLLGPQKNFKHNWNRFVFLSILDIILHSTSANNTKTFMRKRQQIIRLFRMMKLLRSFDGMRKIMLNLSNFFWTTINVPFLVALIFYFLRFLGFSFLNRYRQLNNFINFASAIIVLLANNLGTKLVHSHF